LTATNQNVPPEPIHALSEDAQLIDVARNSMVLVIAGDHLPKPCTSLTDTIMLPAEKLNVDGFQLRNHSLFRRNPPDGEGVGLVASPAVVGEAQECRFANYLAYILLIIWRTLASGRALRHTASVA
jgi:hypothetical protein